MADIDKMAPVRVRRRSEVPPVPPVLAEEIFRPVGSDSPKRRALASARQQNGVRNSPNRVSAGARLCRVFDDDESSL